MGIKGAGSMAQSRRHPHGRVSWGRELREQLLAAPRRRRPLQPRRWALLC